MDKLTVVVDNWPHTNQYLSYVPVLIAIIALAVSLYSVSLTRRSFIASHRPYVWASNYGVIDAEKKTILPIPFRIGYRVKNAPAKILHSEVSIYLESKVLLTHKSEDMVRFPDERSEWNFSIGKEAWQGIMDRPDEEKAKLQRHIVIDYSSLDHGNQYHYKLRQSFQPTDNQWADLGESAD